VSALKKVFFVFVVAGLLLTACGGSKATEVQITLTEFGIQSSLTDFQTDVPYRFVISNQGSVEHEFMIMAPLTEDELGMHMNMSDLDELALAMIEAADLQAGETASFDFTFREAAKAGTLEFACHTPGHYEANMKLPILVE
jgi:uncharacterized cupredoxin-like copper-binding protein